MDILLQKPATQSWLRIKPIFFSSLCNSWGDVEMLNLLVYGSLSYIFMNPPISHLLYIIFTLAISYAWEGALRTQNATLFARCQSGEAFLEGAFWLFLHLHQKRVMSRCSRGSISISFQCSIRSECFAVDKIINKFHDVFLHIIHNIKIYFQSQYLLFIRMNNILCKMAAYHFDLYSFYSKKQNFHP